jgi:hypothetical protein
MEGTSIPKELLDHIVGKPVRRPRGTGHKPGTILFSATGARYQVHKDGSLRRMSDMPRLRVRPKEGKNET